MPNPKTAPAKPVGSMVDRVERLLTPKSNDTEVDTELRHQVRAQATLLQELVNSFRASEDMRLLTAQRNKQLADENQRLKNKIKQGSLTSVTKKEVGSPPQISTAEVSTLSVQPLSLTSSGSTVTLTREQMSELADSVAALKEVAFRRENTWERMARRQVELQKQIKTLKDHAMLANRQLKDGAATIKDQAIASKRDQSTIASLKREINRMVKQPRLDKKSSMVEVMAPPTRRPPRAVTPRDAVVAMLAECRTSNLHGAMHADPPGSRGSSRKEHHHDRQDRSYGERGHVLGKIGRYIRTHSPERIVDKSGYYVETRGGADRRDHVLERRVLEHGSERRTSDRPSPSSPLNRIVGNERRSKQSV